MSRNCYESQPTGNLKSGGTIRPRVEPLDQALFGLKVTHPQFQAKRTAARFARVPLDTNFRLKIAPG